MRHPVDPEGAKYRWLEAGKKILALTRQQGEAIGEGDFARLNVLLTERGRILEGLGDLQEYLREEGPYSDEQWQEIAQLLHKIARLDEAHRVSITRHIEALRDDLVHLDKWRQAARAYGGGRGIPDRGVEA